MNYEVLISEIKNDPLERGYSKMSYGDIVSSLNTKDREKEILHTISGEILLRWLASKGKLIVVEQLKTDEDPLKQNLALVVDKLLNRSGTAIDIREATDKSLLDYAVSIGVLSTDERTELDALFSSVSLISRAEELGLPVVGDGHVKSARELIS